MGTGEGRLFSLSASYKATSLALSLEKIGGETCRDRIKSVLSSKSLDPLVPQISATTWLSQFYGPINFLPHPLFICLSSSKLLQWLQLQALKIMFNFIKALNDEESRLFRCAIFSTTTSPSLRTTPSTW